ncbi:hypothetical protein SJH87_13225 [Staphylococcus sp. GCP4]|nr:hypothetical protein [Staphylococcus sp. GCP4]
MSEDTHSYPVLRHGDKYKYSVRPRASGAARINTPDLTSVFPV